MISIFNITISRALNLCAVIILFLLSSCSRPHQVTFITEYKPHMAFSYPSNRQVVLVGGCFDILHYGHISFLKNAKSEGDLLVVALEPDETISLFKNRLPTHNQYQRAENLAAIKYVDQVLLLPRLNGFSDYNRLVQDIKPDIIAVTSNDGQIKNKQIQAKNVGARLKVVIDRVENFSSSKIAIDQ